MEIIKRELEQSLEQATKMPQNPLNKTQGLNHELELSQNFFLEDNIDCSQQQQQQQHFIPEKQNVYVRRAGIKDTAQPRLN